MFNYSYEQLLTRALGRVKSGMDTNEGSFLYDSITSCVQELYLAYLYCDEMEKRLYADTAYEEYLDRRCAERGIIRETSICSQRIVTISLNGAVSIEDLIGTEWGIEDVTYTLTSVYSVNSCVAKCSQSGTIGNRYSGLMININAVNGVVSASLGEIIVAGEEDETDNSLRKRYFDSFNNMAFGGNIADYKQKVGALDGVGQVKVYPVHDGPGTVLIRILGNDSTIPGQALLTQVQEAVDPKLSTSKGLGIAPIGHTVTVLGATDVEVSLSFTLVYKTGYTYAHVKDDVKDVLDAYVKGLRDEWSDDENIIIRRSQIEAKLLDIPGILDVTNTLINGSNVNVTLDDDEVPVLKDVVVS